MTDLRFSRPTSAATRLGNLAPDSHRFVNKRILLTGESPFLRTPNGRACLLGSLRLLVRICPNVTVTLPPDSTSLLIECRELAAKIEFGRAVEFPERSTDFANFDAILSVGTKAQPSLPWTVINSNGWLARVSSGSLDLPELMEMTNPIGALAAACLGVSEIFKRLIRLKESRGRLFNGLAFSLHSYQIGEIGSGPALPDELILNLLLVGAGAIGNGIVYLLNQLPISGNLWIVDPQVYGEENLGTCLLIGEHDILTPKVELVQRILRDQVKVMGFREKLSEFKNRLGCEVPYPSVIMTALDNIDARHEAQSIWPDILIDGAIGDFPCQTSCHRWGDDHACLICLFRKSPGPSAEKIASIATGLSQSRIQQPDSIVTEEDVLIAPIDRREFLLGHLGRPICSVIREGVAQHISQDNQRKGFAPSVPFVAAMSACMAVGELVKFFDGSETSLETRFQFDILRGPAFGTMVPQEGRSDCDCVTRARNINAWRKLREKTTVA